MVQWLTAAPVDGAAHVERVAAVTDEAAEMLVIPLGAGMSLHAG